jgi:pyruvate kinase
MKKVIVTVGPSLLYRIPLGEVHDDKYIYRINGAHGSVADTETHLLEIKRQVPQAAILIDLPGNKIRTSNLESPLVFSSTAPFRLPSSCLNYPCFYRHLHKGMVAWANDSMYQFVVEAANEREITFLSKTDGTLGNNKGLHVRNIHAELPFLFEKDRQLIQLANRYHTDYIGLSFVRHAEDIKFARRLVADGIEIISKVETLASVQNLNLILENVEYILIDRGDLSTDVGLAKVPAYQDFIISRAHLYNKRVFLATQVLKTMEERPLPTIAEIIDLYTSIKKGIYGIQLSEETAIGKFPKECLETIRMVDDEIHCETKSP